ncbi:polysaccharide biosynthesis/export family protein [Zhongshania sp.]|uniref:polysaccharide biosynthesis/export family protein n=1 Tax=Zhongshania sp. TaxID=1971902 RepID=UPI00356319C3
MNTTAVYKSTSSYIWPILILSLTAGCAGHSSSRVQDLRHNEAALETEATVDQEFSRLYTDRCADDATHFAGDNSNYSVTDPLPTAFRNPGTPRSNESRSSRLLPLSPGDKIEILIHEGEEFSGEYIVNHDGNIELPYLSPIKVMGLDTEEVETRLSLLLIQERIFLAHTLRISVRPMQWAPVMVSVSGAVYEPGRQLINELNPQQTHEDKSVITGDYPTKRYLSEALRSASGVRPDARVDKIILIRDGWQQEINLAGIFSGHSSVDVPLIAGDQIIVPSTGCLQRSLIRPTQITPKGIRVFISNLTETARNNSQAAVGNYSSSMPYGSRLFQAVVSGNCSGGTRMTNSSRYVVLVGKNPLTGKNEVIERNIEEILRNPDVEGLNPYLLPNDTISCYDSTLTNVRDIAKAISDIVSPFKLLR